MLLYNKVDSLFNKENYKELIRIVKTKSINLDVQKKAKLNFFIAKSYDNLNKEDSALIYHQKALKIYKKLKLEEKVIEINSEIFEILKSQNNIKFDINTYLDNIYKYAEEKKSSKWLKYYWTNIGIGFLKKSNTDSQKHYADSARYFFNKAFSLPSIKEDIIKETHLYSLFGSLYSRKHRKKDSALYYYNMALKAYYQDTINYKNLNTLFNILNNSGNALRRSKDYKDALSYYKKAEIIELPKLNRKSKKVLYNNMSASYYYLKDWKNAYEYLYKCDSIKKLINLKDQNALISDIQEQYDNEKLRADNLEIESKRKQNKNLLFAALAFILFGGITAFLIQKNTRKKQKLAEQEKALETQKLATVLKEQELVSIDAMIEGQEKERQRIANDLHDDLGGLMATVKLHFNALKDKQTPELFDKTTTLLDEAYHKVRAIAHAKNSGVIAKQGLLKAVQNMADKISASNKITVDVIDHGLENRLENSLELTIFRIIQELITNVIKHAEATEATIHLTNHEDSLNIMIEDNGKGFNPSQITTKNKGMGISSIDKRVEHLNGTLTIESEHKKGTTIIIDLPI
ncbi:ATP-binding protein [Algibacter sp. 2305UL17-15]|uniref:tetratricopeptide repeat-containing sensor histidine kinase n=1 Tax=Algibacter sp. 2305UL17-15 TaxID=3231268 RepID=UPI00345B3AA1